MKVKIVNWNNGREVWFGLVWFGLLRAMESIDGRCLILLLLLPLSAESGLLLLDNNCEAS